MADKDAFIPKPTDGTQRIHELHRQFIKQQQEENRKLREQGGQKPVIAPSDQTVPGKIKAPAPGGPVAPPVSKQVAEAQKEVLKEIQKDQHQQPPTQPPSSPAPQNPEANANKPAEQK